MHKVIAILGLVMILGAVNWSIAAKEQHLAHGHVVNLALAPVDPRSLMQGDYMALRFALARDVVERLPKSAATSRWGNRIETMDGYVVVIVDERGVGTFHSIFDDQPLPQNSLKMRFRVRNGTLKLATNAYFFQEGHAKYYERARYGEFRVDDKGELLLTAMLDDNLQPLGPNLAD